jgi:hypothetical protein
MKKVNFQNYLSFKLIISLIPFIPMVFYTILTLLNLVNSVNSYFSSENTYGLTIFDFISHDINSLLLLLIPFGIGSAIIIITVIKKRYLFGLLLGVMTIIIIYLLLCLQLQYSVGQCDNSFCGDLYPVILVIYVINCILNLLGILGVCGFVIEIKHLRNKWGSAINSIK